MRLATNQRVQLCCDSCFRTSPQVHGAHEHAEQHFRALGWMWRLDGRQICPICNARESTIPPPPPSS